MGAPRIPSASNENIPIYPYSVTHRRIVSANIKSSSQKHSSSFNGRGDEIARFIPKYQGRV
jgi:hypothetical protein